MFEVYNNRYVMLKCVKLNLLRQQQRELPTYLLRNKYVLNLI